VRIAIGGGPSPEVAAAITAAVQALMASAPPAETAPAVPAWRRAGMLDGVRAASLVASALPAWRASTSVNA